MRKEITIDGERMAIESNALLPKQYRRIFGHDIMKDMRKLCSAYETDPDDADLEVLENVTWLMLRAAKSDVPETVDEWLEGLGNMLAVYEVAGDVVDLWTGSQKTTSTAKKKSKKQRAR